MARVAPFRPGVRVVFISGSSDDVISKHGVLNPGIVFLQKPFMHKMLLGKMRELLDGNPALAQENAPLCLLSMPPYIHRSRPCLVSAGS